VDLRPCFFWTANSQENKNYFIQRARTKPKRAYSQNKGWEKGGGGGTVYHFFSFLWGKNETVASKGRKFGPEKKKRGGGQTRKLKKTPAKGELKRQQMESIPSNLNRDVLNASSREGPGK